MNNDNKVETAIAGLNCWANYATGFIVCKSTVLCITYTAKDENSTKTC